MLNLGQVAQQATESSHLVLNGISIALIVTTAGSLIKSWIDSKGRKRAEVERDTPPCGAHGDRIAKLEGAAVPGKEGRIATLEASYRNLEREVLESRRENREDHERIFDKIEDVAKDIRNGK